MILKVRYCSVHFVMMLNVMVLIVGYVGQDVLQKEGFNCKMLYYE